VDSEALGTGGGVKRIPSKEGAVLSVRLRPDLHTLAQMRQNHLVQFFDIRSEDGRWVENVNRYGDDIQTVDREALLAAIHDIGALTGLDRESRFAERWRGDR
jgi:hypothetical protein